MAIIGQDTFVEAGNTALGLHTPTPSGGAGWALEVSQFTVISSSNAVKHNRNALDRARKGDAIGADIMDVSADVSVAAAGRIAGVCGRMSTDGFTNQYEALLTFNSSTIQNVQLFKNVSGSRTQIGTLGVTVTLSAGVPCTIKLSIRAGTQEVYIDGVLMVSAAELDTTLQGRQYAGIIMNGNNGTNALVDNFLSESVTASTLDGVINGVGTLTGALLTSIDMDGDITGTGVLTADLVTSSQLAGVITGVGTLTGNLVTSAGADIAGVITGTGVLTADLQTSILLSGVITGAGDLDADLQTTLVLAGVINGVATLTADLATSTSVVLAGTIVGSMVLDGFVEGGHITLRFATYDIYIDDVLYALGLLEDIPITTSLSETFTGTRELNNVTVKIGLDRLDIVAALYRPSIKGVGFRLYGYDDGVKTLAWDGIINAVSLDTNALIIQGVPAPLNILERKVPQVLVDITWPQAFSTSGAGKAIDLGVAIPDVIGNVPRSKAVYVNEDLFANVYDYVLCRGAKTVLALYRSLSAGTTAQASLINASEYTISTTLYPGYTVARFPVRQVAVGGGAHTIYADLVTLSGQDIQRNPGRVIRTYLQEAGQLINDASFDRAEAEYARLGYLVDFAIHDPTQLQDVFKNLQTMLDSTLARTSAGWTLDVDIRPTSIDYQLAEGAEAQVPNIVDISPRETLPLLNETSEIILRYLPDTLAGNNTYLGTVRRSLSTSEHATPMEFTFPEIRDWITADKIADYKAKQILTRTETVTVTAPRNAPLRVRSLVSITSPRRRLTNAVYLVRKVDQALTGQPKLECVPWTPDPYIYEAGPKPLDPILGSFGDFSRVPPPVITDVTFPAGAPFAGIEIGPGGGMKAFITMRFVTPTGGNYAYAVVRYRLTSTTLWVPVGGPITQVGTVDVKIRGLEPQTSYDFSVQSFNQWGLTAGGG